MANEEKENTDIILEGPVEDRLLKIRVSQDNGVKAKVFSVFPTEQGPRWRCHVCQVTVFGSRTIYKHERSKEHAENMESPSHPPSKFRAQSPPPKPRQTLLEINLAPGEPVPPGFEGEVQGVTQIQSKLDKFNDAPLIGLEYLVELLYFEDGREPQYICILCDKRGDPRTVMAHLTSYNHRLKYIDTHFHSVSKQMSSYRTNRNYRRGCQTVVANIAEYIEKRFGRLAPHACEKEAFEKKREHYTQTIVRDVHFSDKNGETFEEFVTEEYFEAPAGIPPVNEPPVPGCKSASVEPKKRSPSPPVVNAPGFKKKSAPRDDRRNLSPVSSVSSSSLSDSPLRSRSRSASRNRLLYQHNRRYPFRRTPSRERVRSRSRNRRYGGSRSRSPSPRGRRFGGREPYQSRYKPGYSAHTRPRSDFVLDRRSNKALATESARWEEYRREMTKIEKDLEAVLHSHEKNPEKHPQYPEEWKKFWNRRYKELQAEHKDPAKHDFKPEWIEFWNKRMHELHEIELKAKREFLRKRLNLPEEPPQPIKFRISSKKPAPGGKPIKPSPEPEIILIDDSKTSDEEFERITPDKFETTKRSHSPWEDDFSRKVSRERSRERSLDRTRSRTRDRSRDRTRDFERTRDLNRIREFERSRDFDRGREMYSGKRELYVGHRAPYERSVYSAPVYKKVEEEVDEGPMNVVAVLRLLTALEEKLGSLGPKVIDMLSQALALEKAEANSSETLLDNDVNCVLFETVKEKLKGQLLAGMIDACAEKPAKNAVKQIASLLHMASERKREKEKIEKEQGIKPQPVSVPGVGAVDKSAIAKQIATALVQQGRTDVTQAELEQLINAVVGMAEVSQKTGVQVSTADYVSQLKDAASAPINTTNEKRTEDNGSGTALQILQNAYNEPLNNAMDGLSDSDLETLLQNFKDLSTDEQHRLITYLKKLEAKEPERVERLRKFVNLGPTSQENEEKRVVSKDRESPFSTRLNELNSERKSVPEKAEVPPYVKIDSEDDDDYSFEDVFKAASKNLKEKQLAKEQEESLKSKSDDPNAVLKDAKMLIANLMGQLGQKNVSSSSSSNLLGFSLPEQNPRTVSGPVPLESSSRNTPNVSVANERLPPIANQYGAPPNQFPGYSDYSNQPHDQYAGYRKQNDYPQQNYNNYDGNNGGNYQRHFDDYNNYNSNYDPPGLPPGSQDFNNYPVDMYGNYNQNNYNQGGNPPTYGNQPRGYNNQQRYF